MNNREKPRAGETGEVMVSKNMAVGAAIAAAVIVAGAFYFWPADESGRSSSTDTSTRVESTPTKPASAPPAPTSPNQ
jgi:hypothetical protein